MIGTWRRAFWLTGLALAVWLAFSLASCHRKATVESNRGPVSGTVTFDGKPIPAGTITMVSTSDAIFRIMAPLKDGTFSVADTPLGTVSVAVDTEPIAGNSPHQYVKIPPRYSKTETSGLSITIPPGGAKDVKVELKSE